MKFPRDHKQRLDKRFFQLNPSVASFVKSFGNYYQKILVSGMELRSFTNNFYWNDFTRNLSKFFFGLETFVHENIFLSSACIRRHHFLVYIFISLAGTCSRLKL